MNTACDYDSGSMYGNQPFCDRPATHVITYQYGRFTSQVCERHRNPTIARIFPYDWTERKV